MSKHIIIWDFDGTLSDGTHRLHLLPTKGYNNTESWVSFNLAAGGDAPFMDNIELLRSQYDAGFTIIILTGRSDVALYVSQQWLREHDVPYHELLMRPADDHRRDIDFKEEVLRDLGISNILCAFDDADHVVKHIRSLGITCHQVTHYDVPLAHVRSQEENEAAE